MVSKAMKDFFTHYNSKTMHFSSDNAVLNVSYLDAFTFLVYTQQFVSQILQLSDCTKVLASAPHNSILWQKNL